MPNCVVRWVLLLRIMGSSKTVESKERKTRRDSDRGTCPSKGRAGDTRVHFYNFMLGELDFACVCVRSSDVGALGPLVGSQRSYHGPY